MILESSSLVLSHGSLGCLNIFFCFNFKSKLSNEISIISVVYYDN